MRLAELLTGERIHIPMNVGSVAEGLLQLLPHDAGAGRGVSDGVSLVARLRAGEGGVARRVSRQVLVFNLRGGEEDEPWAALGVAPEPIPGEAEDPDGGEGPTAILVLRLPRAAAFGTGAIENLVRALRDPAVHSALLAAASSEDIYSIAALMDLDLAERLRVVHVLTPLQYRVFPDTPLDEVLELMARRELRSLPVVGEDLQVLGVITGGEALRHALEQLGVRQDADRSSLAKARDVMSRTVMCVSEDQDLLDAAKVMANRDVSQLPVVREGEIVGVLTRDAVLKAVLGAR